MNNIVTTNIGILCLAFLGSNSIIPFQSSAGQSPSATVATPKRIHADLRGEILAAHHRHVQHGTSMGDTEKDTESGKGHNHANHPEQMPAKSALEPAAGAEVEILSPSTMQVFHGDEVTLKYRFVKGKRGHHVHAYVDGILMGMFKRDDQTLIGEGTLTGIEPGQHTLEIRAVTPDHKTELDAIDVVEFRVHATQK